MKKKLICISIFLVALANIAGAQEQLSIKQLADKLFDRYEYFRSLNLYLKLADKEKTDIRVLERIAVCYLNINEYGNAETWYARVVADPKASKISHYNYAEVLLRDQKFDLAKQQYKLCLDNVAELTFKTADCDSAALWMTQVSPNKIANTNGFNTSYSDWGLNYDGIAGYIFTSDRPNGNDIDNRTGNNWFKMYRSIVKTSEAQPLSISTAISEKFNGDYHIGPMALNKTTDTAYITITTETSKKKLDVDKRDWKTKQQIYSRRLQLVIAVKKDEEWTIIGSFQYNNVHKYSVSSAALSNDGKVLYFASDMPGGRGGLDIWYCERQQNGSWGKPINCGKNINTDEDDDFPFISPNGTLYYASKGLPGMGGYDIYTVKGQKADWGSPQNMKYPINTTSDDFYLVTKDGRNGYLSSNREGGVGSDDIYAFMPNPVKSTTKKSTLAGGGKPGESKGQDISFEPIYYDLNKSDIRPDAIVVMDKLIAALKQYPKLKIQVAAFTDSRATDDYNIALSQRRATAAIDYLVTHGINAERLSAAWFGEKDLVNDCPDGVKCTEAQHQLNRRTEFKVITEGK